MDVYTHTRAVKLGNYMLLVANEGTNREMDLEVCNQKQVCKSLDIYSCASVGIVFDTTCHISPNQACHAGLQNEYEGNRNEGALATVSLIHDNEDLCPAIKAQYLQWLLNDSVYADCFVEKDAQFVLDRGFLITHTNVPSNILMGGLIASRRISEYTWIADFFCHMQDAGFSNLNLAYLIAHHAGRATVRNDAGTLLNMDVGHTSVDVTIMGNRAIKRFINNEPFNLNPNYDVNWKYHGVDHAWIDMKHDKGAYAYHDETPLTRIIHKFMDYAELKDGVANKPQRIGLNPFPLDRVVKEIQVCLGAIVNHLVSIEHKIIEELDND